jgi:hypothetical protein
LPTSQLQKPTLKKFSGWLGGEINNIYVQIFASTQSAIWQTESENIFYNPNKLKEVRKSHGFYLAGFISWQNITILWRGLVDASSNCST